MTETMGIALVLVSLVLWFVLVWAEKQVGKIVEQLKRIATELEKR